MGASGAFFERPSRAPEKMIYRARSREKRQKEKGKKLFIWRRQNRIRRRRSPGRRNSDNKSLLIKRCKEFRPRGKNKRARGNSSHFFAYI
jgi:hypothetical protein